MDKVSAKNLTSRTIFSIMTETLIGQMPTSDQPTCSDTEWYPVTVSPITVVEAIELKNNLLMSGLDMNKDFVWAYKQAEWDNMTGNTPSMAKYGFRDPALATFYKLKWQ
jgi:hypothetical protein